MAQTKPTSWNQFLAASLDAQQQSILHFVPARTTGNENTGIAKQSSNAEIDWDKAMKGVAPPRLIPIESKALQSENWEAGLTNKKESIDVIPSPIWIGLESLLRPIEIPDQLQS